GRVGSGRWLAAAAPAGSGGTAGTARGRALAPRTAYEDQRATAGPGGCRTGPGQRAGPAGPGRQSGLDPLAGTAAMTTWRYSMRLMVMMVVLAGLAGCAGMASQPGYDRELADGRAKVGLWGRYAG